MTYATYQELNVAARAHYQQGDFAQALALLDAEAGQFPQFRREADYLRSCLAVRVGNVARTYEILDAFHADGIWMDENLFRASPSYAPLQGVDEFERRVQAHAELRTRTEPGGPARLHVLPPAGSNAALPVIFHLHGNGSSPSAELPHWQPAADQGWLVAAPPAEKAFFQGGNAFWPDHETAVCQLITHFANLKKNHALEAGQIILTGFSMGGDVAIAQTLRGEVIPARGFLVVGPGGPMIDEPESYRPLIEAAQGRGLRGVMMISRADPAIEPDKAAQLAQMLNDGGIPCQLIEYPDTGHVYPADFAERLNSALAFVLTP